MINFKSAKGFTAQELVKLDSARIMANSVLPSAYYGDKFKALKFTNTNDAPSEILQRIRMDWLITISIVTPPFWKRWFSKEVAYECSDGSVTLERNKFSKQDVYSVCQTLVHEVFHVAGYRHSSAHDLTSAPYAGGILAEQVARTMNQVSEHLEAVKETNS